MFILYPARQSLMIVHMWLRKEKYLLYRKRDKIKASEKYLWCFAYISGIC